LMEGSFNLSLYVVSLSEQWRVILTSAAFYVPDIVHSYLALSSNLPGILKSFFLYSRNSRATITVNSTNCRYKHQRRSNHS
jgi:hypothetical protein